jgi:oligopeptide transport system permease protein
MPRRHLPPLLRFILGRLVSSAVVLLILVTLSFFLMRFAPGGPFDSDKKLPPTVEANKWMKFKMGVAVEAPVAGTISDLAAVTSKVTELNEGDRLMVLTPKDGGPAIPIGTPYSGTIVSLNVRSGDQVPAGATLAIVPKPALSQYLDAIGGYLTLDFGVTFSSDGARTVNEELLRALPISLQLGGMALIFALLLGVPAGLIAGARHNTWVDHGMMTTAMLGVSVPTMVSGPIMIAIFSLGLGLFPPGGWESSSPEWSTWQHRILPVITLGLAYVPTIARLTRGGMLEVSRSDWIRTARAKGLSESLVIRRHAFRGAILPTVSWLGPGLASIVTGSVIVETVYRIPGLAENFVKPALNRDYPMVIGVVVVYAAILILMNLIVDIAYTFLDPRVGLE